MFPLADKALAYLDLRYYAELQISVRPEKPKTAESLPELPGSQPEVLSPFYLPVSKKMTSSERFFA